MQWRKVLDRSARSTVVAEPPGDDRGAPAKRFGFDLGGRPRRLDISLKFNGTSSREFQPRALGALHH